MKSEDIVASRYKLLWRLGKGGMSEVWVAEDTKLNRQVAIKFLHEQLEDTLRERFLREGEITARLSHPNIVPVFDQGFLNNGRPYIVMEYVLGQTLKEKEKRGFSEDEMLSVFIQILDAIEHAHQAGIVHRDLKPDNILIEEGGRVRVFDFGVAREIESLGSDTESGTIIGTARYLSPEQAHGEEASEQSDLYSIGIMLYEALAGRAPWGDDNAIASLVQQSTEPADPPSKFNKDVPSYLDNISLKAIAYRRDLRFQTAAEFKQALLNKEESKSLSWRWLLLALPLIIFAGWWYFDGTRTVPDLEGKTLLEARKTLYQEDLKWFSRQSPSQKPEGTVVLSSPDAGVSVRKNDTIVLFISSGPPSTTVPAVLNLPAEKALSLLSEVGLKGRVSSGSGNIISSTPAPGEEVKQGSVVVLQGESQGAKPLSCIGLYEPACRNLNPNFLIITKEIASEEPTGIIVRETYQNDSLTLFLSAGINEVIVPDLLSLSLAEAKDILRSESLGAIVQYGTDTPGKPGTVLKQTPNPGLPVRPGSEVLLIINQ